MFIGPLAYFSASAKAPQSALVKVPVLTEGSEKRIEKGSVVVEETTTEKKTKRLGMFVLLGSLFSPLSASAEAAPLVFSPLQGIEWVEKCVERYPEVLWLADKNVRKTEEAHASLSGTYSEKLFGQKYVEFDRTFMTLHCLKLVLKGGEEAYRTFSKDQPEEKKLTFESFQQLHAQGQKLLHSQWKGMSESQIAQAMETALILGDMGKSEKARLLFKKYKIHAPDHDDFYGEAIKIIEKHPRLSPSFAKLPPAARNLLVKGSNVAHYGHITHLEGSSKMFSKLRESGIPSKDPFILAFDLFVHTCDVAGALGHVNNQSSLVYIESTHQAMQAMKEAVSVLADPNKTEQDAYDQYVAVRSSWLGLNSASPADRVLARIGAMLRLFSKEEGNVLKQAMNSLDLQSREKIARELDDQGVDHKTRTPTYMPAVLVNLAGNPALGASSDQRLFSAVAKGLPFIARVLEAHKQLIGNQRIDPNIPLNFNRIAGIAKESPELLQGDFSIDQEGNVSIKK